MLEAPDPVAQAAGTSNGNEQLPADCLRPGRPALAALPPSPGGDLGQQRGDGRRRRLARVRDLAVGQGLGDPADPAPQRRPARQPPRARAAAGWPGLAVYNSDGRLRHEVEFTPELARRFYSHSGTPEGVVENDLEIAALPRPTSSLGEVELRSGARDRWPSPAVHPDEAADIARIRDHRIQAGGKTYHLLRGEFHRHTEISQDGGADGALEDMWRYAIDAAGLDWIGNGDHDNGGGKEYTWWLIQKTTDLYHNPPAFMPMFTYERSVSYPARPPQRDVPDQRASARCPGWWTTERRQRTTTRKMLYDYLQELDGICASHTSGTEHGDRLARQRPEGRAVRRDLPGAPQLVRAPGRPRVARRPSEAIGGWQPLGMIWNALAMQYKLGFQASSDHISTHISYAFAIAEEPHPRGDLRRLQEAALLRRDRQHPARRPLRAST